MIRVAVYAAMRRLGLRWVITLGCIATFLLVWADSALAAETLVVKSTDESVAGSATLQADDQLVFAGTNGIAYEVEMFVRYASPNGGATPDLKFSLGEDTTARGSYNVLGLPLSSDAATNTTGEVETDSSNGRGTAAVDRTMLIRGSYISGGGTLTFAWAQNTSDANATIVRAGSSLRVTPIGEASGGGSPGAEELSDLTDVDTTGAIDGAVLKYDEADLEWQVATDEVGSGSSGPVTLSAGDRNRLDLAWWGIWALVGCLFVVMIAPIFLRVFDVRHGLGGRFERG